MSGGGRHVAAWLGLGAAVVAAVAAAIAGASSCRSSSQGTEGVDGGGASATTQASASGSASGAASSEPDKIHSVYPLDAGKPDELAARFCAALQEAPVTRRATCCSTNPGVVVTSECVRMLTTAITSQAVALSPADVDACVAAMDRALGGCDWVGPNAPQPPAACLGVLHGTLDTGARCRSSLECKEGLRCLGVGPTDPGTCGPPRDDGSGCGTAVDPLATYARQNDYEARHPECKGWCDRHRCEPAAALGAACRIDAQCGAGRNCVGGTCASGAAGAAALAASARKAAGQPCTSDSDCIGGCVRPDGGTKGAGVCGMKCR